MTIIDDEYDPIAEADTGMPKEWTDEEVRAMFEEDEERITALRQGKQVLKLMNKVLDQIEKENAEDEAQTTSILREKILRGVGLSDSELENAVFFESCRLLFGKTTTKEFLRRMVIVAGLTDIDSE